MNKISRKKAPESETRTAELIIAVNLVFALALLRVGAAEIAALVILLRELRRWNC